MTQSLLNVFWKELLSSDIHTTVVLPTIPWGIPFCLQFCSHVLGGFWDFTSDLTFKDTAYTSEALDAHTDNTYFTDPARLQLFHLLSHTDGDGGTSLLVDGFEAAKVLYREKRAHFHNLAKVPQPFHASGNDDVCIQPAAQVPVFTLHPQHQRLFQIRWNNYDRAPKNDWNMGEQLKWYDAARAYNDIIHRPEMQLWSQLEPGTALSKSSLGTAPLDIE